MPELSTADKTALSEWELLVEDIDRVHGGKVSDGEKLRVISTPYRIRDRSSFLDPFFYGMFSPVGLKPSAWEADSRQAAVSIYDSPQSSWMQTTAMQTALRLEDSCF